MHIIYNKMMTCQSSVIPENNLYPTPLIPTSFALLTS